MIWPLDSQEGVGPELIQQFVGLPKQYFAVTNRAHRSANHLLEFLPILLCDSHSGDIVVGAGLTFNTEKSVTQRVVFIFPGSRCTSIAKYPVSEYSEIVNCTSFRRARWASVSCEIDQNRQETMMFSATHLLTVRNQTHRVGADFLRIDSQVGLIFCRMSLSETDREGRRRMTRIARRAYDSIMLLSLQIELTDSEAIELDRNLSRLKGKRSEQAVLTKEL